MTWFCYCLISDSGKTYIGATVDLDHRLRQHNGEIKGGARATSMEPGTWRRVCHVSGFPDNHSALQFEWRWKQLSRQKSYTYMDPIDRRFCALNELLLLDKPTSKAVPYSTYEEGGPKVTWEL